eukprot:gnl/TRDRNA2_/TRDRNA2_150994_c4_seq1.p1 gnl/TRDRNA2_/TRDRNA2_150994_c4~~gnl/TRDRNA2_/TRDRNA2_150994_c4_seq1.p1  ORF type:complete len:134 (+),score=27.97 gnl/TRDRNA2_/TRDRNA2_150994_c4_seq1:50-403(+)
MAADGGLSRHLEHLLQPAALGGILWTGLISTALTIPMQASALKKMPASDAIMIISTEPLWAAGFASLFLGERLENSALIGGGLILLGTLSNTLLPADLGTGIGDGKKAATKESSSAS